MKIKVVSDLHLEFNGMKIKNNGVDVLILSGDILIAKHLGCALDYDELMAEGNITEDQIIAGFDDKFIIYERLGREFKDFLMQVNKDFPHVIYIMGNHEHYNGSIDKSADIIRSAIKFYNLNNIHFLDNETFQLDNINFIGTTLWTDMNKSDPLTMFHVERNINDFHIISVSKEHRRFNAIDVVAMHNDCLKFITGSIKDDMTNVVVGHHAPSHISVADQYKDGTLMNGAFVSDLNTFILNNQSVTLWIHGHCHNNSEYMIGDTRVFCNPRGYKNENPFFDVNNIIEI